MKPKGMTLIESLISLSLFLLILTATMEFVGLARAMFFKLRDASDEAQAAAAAQDKIRIDLMRAGLGLVLPMKLGLVEAVTADSEGLTIRRAERAADLEEDLIEGQTSLTAGTIDGAKKGVELCFCDSLKGEIREIARAEGTLLILSSPLANSYSMKSARVTAMEKIAVFLDREARILRRRVDSGAAQPLVENVEAFACSFDKDRNLASVSFVLASRSGKEKTHEFWLYPKNAGLPAER
ncbi:MAG: prepilin-type N-terminal cleavage/methylation domain-containing protein [Candidatus Aminicenantales bacterium]